MLRLRKAKTMNARRTIAGSTLEYSAKPPQTPAMILSRLRVMRAAAVVVVVVVFSIEAIRR
jgi:hypothetical protein